MNGIEIYHEAYRPQFHFTPATNWLSDPDGLVYYQGEYHLFFQHNPVDNNWGNMTWGHAISSDLVHWRQLPNAIEPDERGTAFSGSAVVDRNNTGKFKTGENDPIVVLYTAAGDTSPESVGKPYTQCLCFSNDKGRTWERFAGNPVVPHIVGQNRDPKVTWYKPGKFWLMALYLDGNDFALLTSNDLRTWSRLQVVTIDGASECPDFFELSCIDEPSQSFWVFTTGNGRYVVGTFDGSRFDVVEGPFLLDFGPNFHAPQSFANIPGSDGRRIQMAWMAGGSYPRMPFNQQLTFPCELTLRKANGSLRLFRYPVAEIVSLRQGKQVISNLEIGAIGETPVSIEGGQFDLSAEVDFGTAESLEFSLNGVILTCKRDSIAILSDDCCAPMITEANRLTLRILVDRTSIEIFANGGAVSMTFCYLPAPENEGLSLKAVNGTARIIDLSVSRLLSAWPEPVLA